MKRGVFVFFIAAAGLFAVLYWGLDTKSPDQQKAERQRVPQFSSAALIPIQREAKEQLDPNTLNVIESLEFSENRAATDSAKVEALKQLSSAWFRIREPALAGHYAEEVAELDSTAEAWSIAGTTYGYGLQMYDADKLVKYCVERAIAAFENAISLDPDEVDYRTNLAVLYADYPPQDNPMKGILMLRQLQETYPGDTGVLIQLARFGVQTGQYDKAAQRLQQVIAIDPNEMRAICMLADVYEQLNRPTEAEAYRQRCQ